MTNQNNGFEAPVFFKKAGPLSLQDVLALTQAQLPEGMTPEDANAPAFLSTDDDGALHFTDIAPLDQAQKGDIAFLDNKKYLSQLDQTAASAVLINPRYSKKLPAHIIPLLCNDPYRAYANLAEAFYPDARYPQSTMAQTGHHPQAHIHDSAILEEGVIVEAGAVIGAHAWIGEGSVISAGATIGANVTIGRHCQIGARVSVMCAMIGNHVVLHPGCTIGQDGFGFAMGPQGHKRIPQVGRVIIQDHVDIGANSCIDRGANRDTIIGEGTKIDNLVQIGHNVVIGRHCVIAGQTGVSGSVIMEDFVVLGGQVGVVGHIRIGQGAQIAGSSNVGSDVPAGVRWGGTPAKPVREWMREATALKNLASGGATAKTDGTTM
jgi:UDP-3-O-[3-hydroxymyristoyl] glucosamine N-acyltransferase